MSQYNNPTAALVNGRFGGIADIAAKLLTRDGARRIAATKSIVPKTPKHAFEPRAH